MNQARRRRTDAIILAVAGVLALGVPLLASAHLHGRIDQGLSPVAANLLGETVDIGGVEVGLSGVLRLTDVSVGAMFEARSIEASVTLAHLLAGRVHADEIRVEGPRLRVHVDSTGKVDLAALLRRTSRRIRARRRAKLAGPQPGATRRARLRRIVVTGGALRVDLHGRGTMRIGDLTLVPHRGGLRVVAADTHIDLGVGPWRLRGHLARTGADLDLLRGGFTRALSVGGELRLESATAPTLTLTQPAVGLHIRPDRAFDLRGRIVQAGEDGQLSARSRSETPRRLEIYARHLPLAAFAPAAPRGVVLDRAHATGTIVLDLTLADLIGATADVQLTNTRVDSRRIAAEAFDLSGRLELSASVRRGAGSYAAIHRFVVTSRALAIRGTARVAPLGSPRRGRLSVNLARTTCAGAITSLPAPLRGHLTGLSLAGSMEASAVVSFDRDAPDRTSLDVGVDLSGCKVRSEAIGADPRQLRAPFEHTFPDGSRARVGVGEASYATLQSLPAHVIGAFVAAEDARFYRHNGFDVDQIERSLAIDLARGAFLRGGSTISQQLVKNVFLSPTRSMARKLQEALLTWRIEARLSKRQILERYLNIIELGIGVFGVDAAARHWFDKSPQRLTVREAAFLAALTPAPRTISRRIHRANRIDAATNGRVDTVLRAMRRAGVIDRVAAKRAAAARLTISRSVLARR